MKRFIEFPLETGESIVVEVEEPKSQGDLEPAASPDGIVTKAGQTFEAALESIKPTIGVIIAKLRGLRTPPHEVGVEFGLKLSAKAGAFIASAGTEANFKVTLTWKSGETKENKL